MSNGTTSRQASRCKMDSWKASTDAYGMNASTSTCSAATAMPRKIIEEWRIDYNLIRPHTSLDGLTPNEFATRSKRDHNVNRASLMNGYILGSMYELPSPASAFSMSL